VRRAPRLARVRVALAALVAATCVHDVHRLGPIAPPPSARPPEVRVLVFGDFGYRTLAQWLVARAIRRESHARPFDLALELGDDLYMCGPDPARAGAEGCRFGEDGATVVPGYVPPAEPLFRLNEERLEGLVGRDGAPLTFFLALGNHDVGWGAGRCDSPGIPDDEATRRRACLSVAHRTPTWTMPARHYVVDRGPIRIVVVDTNVVVADYGGLTLDEEVAFVRSATAGCGEERVCFLAGHHPPAAVHGYGRGRAPAYAARMARLVAAANGRAVAFFAGHVHTLEHLALGPLDVFISGSTAMGGSMRLRWKVPASAQARFVTTACGFAILEADRAGWRVRFQDFEGEPLHCCEAAPRGPCLPVECR